MACVLVLACVWLPGPADATEPTTSEDALAPEPIDARLRVATGYHWSTGTYGTDQPTDVHYVPADLSAIVGPWSLGVTIPWLRISGSTAVVGDGAVRTGVLDEDETRDGLGDVIVRLAYFWVPPPLWAPGLEGSVSVKVPTASVSNNLGTGETDVRIELEAFRAVGPVTLSGAAGFQYRGRSPLFELQDGFVGSVAVIYPFGDRGSIGVQGVYQTRASRSVGDVLEVLPFGAWKITERWSADVYAIGGILDGSPDAGVGVSIGYAWPLPTPPADRPATE